MLRVTDKPTPILRMGYTTENDIVAQTPTATQLIEYVVQATKDGYDVSDRFYVDQNETHLRAARLVIGGQPNEEYKAILEYPSGYDPWKILTDEGIECDEQTYLLASRWDGNIMYTMCVRVENGD